MQRVTLIALYDEYCLGVRYMSSVLQNEGHHVNIIVFKGVENICPTQVPPPDQQEEGGYYGYCTCITANEKEILLNLLKEQDPHLIGLSFSSMSFGVAKFISKVIQQVLKKPVIWGGVDSTINAEENIQYPDYLCIGEGEYPLRALVNTMDRGGDTDHIPSIWVNRDGNVIRNPLMKLEQNLDNYPYPDFELENKTLIINNSISEAPYPPHSHLYTNFMIMGTRGCPFNCTYCCSGHQRKMYAPDRYMRSRSVDNVIQELKYRVQSWPWPLERIEFYDDVLPANKKWVAEFSPKFATEIGLPFFGYTHPNVGEPRELSLLHEVGMHYLIMGVQSGSQRVLKKYYNRLHPKERTIRTAQNILDSGARLLVDFIGHNPLETEEDNIETLDLICDLPRPMGIITINPMAFYDNYRIYHIAKEEGIFDQLERPKGVHAYQAKTKPEYIFWEMLHLMAHFEGFSKENLMGLVNDEYLRKNPQVFAEMVTNLYNATYLDHNPVVNKEQYIQQLRWRVWRVEKSPVYRTYCKIKNLVA